MRPRLIAVDDSPCEIACCRWRSDAFCEGCVCIRPNASESSRILPGTWGKCSMFSVSYDAASAGRGKARHWSARASSAGRNAVSEASDDDGGAFDRRKVAAQAGDVRCDLVGRAHVHEDDVIVGMMEASTTRSRSIPLTRNCSYRLYNSVFIASHASRRTAVSAIFRRTRLFTKYINNAEIFMGIFAIVKHFYV